MFAGWASALGCASPPPETASTERVAVGGFSVLAPTGSDWDRRILDDELVIHRLLEQAWSQKLVLDLKVLHAFEEPVHPYDLLAMVRMMASTADRGDRLEVLDHAEKLIRHEGMDCADFQVVMTENAPVGSPPGFAYVMGRGMICAHPSDRRRVVDVEYVVRNLDGRLLAVDQQAGNAFVESIRWQPLDGVGNGAAK